VFGLKKLYLFRNLATHSLISTFFVFVFISHLNAFSVFSFRLISSREY